jgi:hypothetical protein
VGFDEDVRSRDRMFNPETSEQSDEKNAAFNTQPESKPILSLYTSL